MSISRWHVFVVDSHGSNSYEMLENTIMLYEHHNILAGWIESEVYVHHMSDVLNPKIRSFQTCH